MKDEIEHAIKMLDYLTKTDSLTDGRKDSKKKEKTQHVRKVSERRRAKQKRRGRKYIEKKKLRQSY